MVPKASKEEFVQEYLYIEDYYPVRKPDSSKEKPELSIEVTDSDEEVRGVIIIDMMS